MPLLTCDPNTVTDETSALNLIDEHTAQRHFLLEQSRVHSTVAVHRICMSNGLPIPMELTEL